LSCKVVVSVRKQKLSMFKHAIYSEFVSCETDCGKMQ